MSYLGAGRDRSGPWWLTKRERRAHPAGAVIRLTTIQVHASCVEFAGLAVLLRGASGGGKSDLALRLVEAGARLVADDRTDLTLEEGTPPGHALGHLIASAPAALAGRLEVRGVGIVQVPWSARAKVALVVDLVSPEAIERLPRPNRCIYLGVAVPLLAATPFEASAPAKLRVALGEAVAGRLFAADADAPSPRAVAWRRGTPMSGGA